MWTTGLRGFASSAGVPTMCRDRDGMEFALWQPGPGTTRPPANGVHAGDVAYLTYGVPESSAFREFYGALFGWTFTAGRVADGWEPDGGAPMSGMRGGAERATVTPMWLVEDIETAVERVVVEGGRVLEQPDRQPYGISAYCADDQGGRFYLLET
jgi:predicted enzyme related to lactoylglutathione lyase